MFRLEEELHTHEVGDRVIHVPVTSEGEVRHACLQEEQVVDQERVARHERARFAVDRRALRPDRGSIHRLVDERRVQIAEAVTPEGGPAAHHHRHEATQQKDDARYAYIYKVLQAQGELCRTERDEKVADGKAARQRDVEDDKHPSPRCAKDGGAAQLLVEDGRQGVDQGARVCCVLPVAVRASAARGVGQCLLIVEVGLMNKVFERTCSTGLPRRRVVRRF